MKTQEQIDQLAEKYATSIYGFSNENYNDYLKCKRHCIEFYSQCQEDMADKKYTEEDMRQAMICVIVSNSIKNSQDITEYSASINKQD